MNESVIPRATMEKIAAVHPKGTRHQAAIDIALPMIGQGLPEAAVFATLRSKFDTDMPDSELWGVVRWAANKRPEPATFGGNPSNRREWRPQAQEKSIPPLEKADWWVSGSRLTPDQFKDSSPTKIPDEPIETTRLCISSLYSENDNLNIVCKFILGDDGKAKPSGAGKVQSRDSWLSYLDKISVPESEAGAWIRPNPCNPIGSGQGGAITDADISDYRFLLVESDMLPITLQLALFRRLPLPIASVVLSGGGSAHAWIKIGASNASDFRDKAERILSALKPFGIDQANKNASRLSRLPGAERKIGAAEDSGLQRLLWLNPNCRPISDEDIKALEAALLFPAIEERPLLALARDAADRYEYMRLNQGKLGVPTGIKALDAVIGGMKPGHTIVVAGATGGGKSTLALHLIHSALNANVGVLLFSLEMDKEEVFDLIVSARCRVDRNKFNTGAFTEIDGGMICAGMPEISRLPLYIEDSALSNVEQIRLRTIQLKSAGKIGLAIVDYIQFVNPGLSRESREQQVAAISHSLRALAREVKIPVVVLSQLNDEGKLRESRVIAHNANVVMVVDTEDGNKFKIKVVKGRSIPTGEYEMEFVRAFAMLANYGI